MRLIIHAPFMYAGGGKSVLIGLLRGLCNHREDFSQVLLVLDRRFEEEYVRETDAEVLTKVDPTLRSWIRAERILAASAQENDVVLCLANVPPLFRIKGFVATYVQNTYIAGTDPGVRLPWRRRFPIWFQQAWFRLTLAHSHLFFVQTPSMRDRLLTHTPIRRERIALGPFFDPPAVSSGSSSEQASLKWDFGYLSLPWPHKNHRRLLEAFVLLAEQGLAPSLALTVPEAMDARLARYIEEVKRDRGVRVTNLGVLPYEGIAEFYRSIGALIFPSLSESFALPLLEAGALNVPIIAAERDYVRDVAVPRETFDPESPRSIMRAVLRFLGSPDKPPGVPRSSEFLGWLLQIAQTRMLRRSGSATGPARPED
jgi:glycosyltransferase involved in cell wall biosynthesis